MQSTLKVTELLGNQSQENIDQFYAIMLKAYAITEARIWGENYQRMSRQDFSAVIEKGELIGAWIDGQPVGSIHTYRISENTFAFGLFSVDFHFKGLGIGRKLIQEAENKAREEGAHFMELEILRPENETLKFKTILHDWYQRLGYELIETVSFIDRKPSKKEYVDRFIQPCVFDCYRKKL